MTAPDDNAKLIFEEWHKDLQARHETQQKWIKVCKLNQQLNIYSHNFSTSKTIPI